MFDNVFGFAGPVGTAAFLVIILFGLATFVMLGGRVGQLSGRVRV